MGAVGDVPQKLFKIRVLRLAKNEFHATKFPGFSPDVGNFVENSLTFPQVFRVSRHHVLNIVLLLLPPTQLFKENI